MHVRVCLRMHVRTRTYMCVSIRMHDNWRMYAYKHWKRLWLTSNHVHVCSMYDVYACCMRHVYVCGIHAYEDIRADMRHLPKKPH